MAIGIEIGGTKLQLVRGDSEGRIQVRRKLSVDPNKGAAGIREQIASALPELIRNGASEAIGVGFGGPVDWKTGRICRSHQIEGWSEFDLARWLGDLSGCKVRVDNDANVAALGEALHGAGLGSDPAFYVTLGSGVGGGLVVGGHIYHGATPGEAEIGHVRLDRAGAIVESRCSGWAVDARIRQLKKKDPDTPLAQLTAGTERSEARFLGPAAERGDQGALRILDDLAEDLAFGLSHVVHLFHPQVIIIGGGLSGIGDHLRTRVQQALLQFTMEAFQPGPKVCLAALGEDAVPVGALELATAVWNRR